MTNDTFSGLPKLKQTSIGLLMATELESLPLIEDYGFERVPGPVYPTYVSNNTTLVISGIGKAHSAAACAWMIEAISPRVICNAGAAGTTGDHGELGALFQIGKVVEADRPCLDVEGLETFEASLYGDLPIATLATQDHPVVSNAERLAVRELADLVDMEGAAVVQTCDTFAVRAHLVKFVTDTHDGHSIAGNIVRLREDFCRRLLRHLESLSCCECQVEEP